MRVPCGVLALVLTVGCPAPPGPCPEGCDAGEGGRRDSGAVTDGGPPPLDAGAPGDGGALDWRGVRGVPHRLSVVGEYEGEPAALFAGSFAVAAGDGGRRWRWFSDAGELLAERAPVFENTSRPFSEDGTLLSAVSLVGARQCQRSDGSLVEQVEGAPVLLELESGAERHRLPQTLSPLTPDRAFTSGSRWWRWAEFNGCDDLAAPLRSTRAPFAPPPALASLPTAYIEDELPGGALLGDSQGAVFYLWPEDAGSAVRLGEGQTVRSGAWVHVFEGSPVRRIVHFDAAALASRSTALPFEQRDHLAGPVAGRWAQVLGLGFDDAGVRPVELHDGRAQLGPWSIAPRPLPRPLSVAIAHREDFAVFSPSGTQRLARLDLREGTVTPLGLPEARLRPLGGGRLIAAEDAQSQRTWLIFRDRVEEVPEALAVLGFDGLAEVPKPQDDLVFLIGRTQASQSLEVLDAATGRRVRLTDALYFNPPFQAPFFADGLCAMPGFARSVGAPVQSGLLPSKHLHFTEFVAKAQPALRVFTLPIDLSQPPRLLAELPPEQCSPPLVSRDARRWWLPVKGSGVVRAVFADD